MAFNFPTNPALNDQYSAGSKTYKWNGVAWLIIQQLQSVTTSIITGLGNSISTNTGALIVAGGLGVAKDLHIGGILYTNGVPVVTTASFNVSDGPTGGVDINIRHYVSSASGTSTIFINNISTLQSVTSRGNSTTNALLISNTVDAVSTTTGALTVAGGVGIGGTLYVPNINITGNVYKNGLPLTNAGYTGATGIQGATGAGVTAFGGIGSVIMASNISTAYTMPGGTIAGSSLVYPSTFVAQGPYDGVSRVATQGGITGLPNTNLLDVSYFRSEVTGNTGYFVPVGTTALSGTWRAMTFSGARGTYYDVCNDRTSNYSSYTLWVRVS